MTLTLPENYPDPDAPFARKHPVLLKHMADNGYEWLIKSQEITKAKRVENVCRPVETDRLDGDVTELMAPVVIPAKPIPAKPVSQSKKGEWIALAILTTVFLIGWCLCLAWTKHTYGAQEPTVSSHATVQPYVRGSVGE